MDQQAKNIMFACAAVYGGFAFLFLIYFCKILTSCTKNDVRVMESDMKSAATGFSEMSVSVCADDTSKANTCINEGYLVDITVEDNRMKTFPNVDQKEDDQFSCQPPLVTSAEDELKDMKRAA